MIKLIDILQEIQVKSNQITTKMVKDQRSKLVGKNLGIELGDLYNKWDYNNDDIWLMDDWVDNLPRLNKIGYYQDLLQLAKKHNIDNIDEIQVKRQFILKPGDVIKSKNIIRTGELYHIVPITQKLTYIGPANKKDIRGNELYKFITGYGGDTDSSEFTEKYVIDQLKLGNWVKI